MNTKSVTSWWSSLLLAALLSGGCQDKESQTDRPPSTARVVPSTQTSPTARKKEKRWTKRRLIERSISKTQTLEYLKERVREHPLVVRHEWREDGTVMIWPTHGEEPFIYTPDFTKEHEHLHHQTSPTFMEAY